MVAIEQDVSEAKTARAAAGMTPLPVYTSPFPERPCLRTPLTIVSCRIEQFFGATKKSNKKKKKKERGSKKKKKKKKKIKKRKQKKAEEVNEDQSEVKKALIRC